MSAVLSMKCHCGPRGSSFALAWRVRAAKTAATKIVLITRFHGRPLSANRINAGTDTRIYRLSDKPMTSTANYAAVWMAPNPPRTAQPIQAIYFTRDGLSCFRGRSRSAASASEAVCHRRAPNRQGRVIGDSPDYAPGGRSSDDSTTKGHAVGAWQPRAWVPGS
jgi:hypothetical protein